MSALDQPSPFEDGHRYETLSVEDFDTLTRPRYVVTELVGYATPRRGNKQVPPGTSFSVIDTLVNRQLVSTFRSEYGGVLTRKQQLDRARDLAHERAAELNAEHERFMARLT